MNFGGLSDQQTRERYVSMVRKKLIQPFRERCASRPVFVFGRQRSGTSMLMYAFHRHPDILVYDEHRDSTAFKDYRIRGFTVLRQLLTKARFTAVCFKPICDSHLIDEFARVFPDGHYIWMYRHYADVANSTLRKFLNPTRAIRLICTNQPGGGWLQEGVSPSVAETLQRVFRPELSEFDLSCLVWWARNSIVFESRLLGCPNLTLLKYESVASAPDTMLRWLFDRIGISYYPGVSRSISARSIRRYAAPAMDPQVESLCEGLLVRLDEAFLNASPPATAASQRSHLAFANSGSE